MSARRIRNGRNFHTARVALTTLLALAMTFGSVPTCALQALAEDAEEAAVTLAAPGGDGAGADAVGLGDEAAAEPTDEGGTEDEAAEDAAAEDEPEEAPAGEEAYVEETEASEPEAEGEGAEETPAEAEDAESEPAIFEAETDDVRVRLTVAAEAELPEGAHLVVTTLRGDVEGEQAATVAAIDADVPATGADAALAALTEAVQARANKDAKKASEQATELAVADAYVVELVDADGNVVAVDEDQAELEVTFANEDALEDYDGLYTVERKDAKADEAEASVYATADEEYADADDAAEALDYSGEAEDVSDELLEDTETGEISLDLEGVAAVVGVKAASGPRKAVTNNPSNATISTIDNTDYNITINLFDYEAVDSNQNNYSNPKTSGINTGRTSKTTQLQFYGHGTVGTGINNFAGYDSDSNYYDGLYDQQYAMQGIVKSTLSGSSSDAYSTRYPVLNTISGDNLSYLFKPENVSGQKTAYPNVTNLFYTEGNRMVYDSNQHYAYYNKTGANAGKFTVYQDTYYRNGNTLPIGFFPFDAFNSATSKPGVSINPTEGAWNSSSHVNHHLGMSVEIPITMPYGGRIKLADGTYEDMVFDFSGDDDMWVFVDGQLVLDVGGIHQPVHGQINFATGEVTLSSGVNNVQQPSYAITASGISDTSVALGTKSNIWQNKASAGQKYSFAGDQWRGGTSHTVQIFYLERGGCDSNLMISTNLYLMTKKSVSVSKAWASGTADADKQPVNVQLIRKAMDRSNPPQVVGYHLVDTKPLNSGNNWSASWSDLATEGYNPSGVFNETSGATNTYCDYTYLVREEPVAGFDPIYSYNGSNLDVTEVTYSYVEGGQTKTATGVVPVVTTTQSPISITNVPTYIDVEKTWRDSTNTGADTASHTYDSVYVQLYKQTRNNADSAWGSETAVGSPVELKNGAWSTRLKISETGENVRYIVKEGTYDDGTFTAATVLSAAKTSASDSDTGKPYEWVSTTYTPSTGSEVTDTDSSSYQGISVPRGGHASAVIANKPQTTSVTVEKEWTDYNTNTHDSDTVYVQLYHQVNGETKPYGSPVPLGASSDDADNNWKYTWTNLEPTGKYTVAEGTIGNNGFVDATMFTFNDKVYSQQSIKYYDKDDNELTASNLDGTVIPNAGKVVITNGPLSAKIKLKKVDADSTTTTIKGATFVLLKDSGNNDTYGPEDTTRVPNADATFTTGNDGTVELPGLDPGTYWLQETSAPEGYLLHDQNHPICIKVKDDCEVELELEDDTYNTGKLLPTRSEKDANDVYTLTVPNLRVYALPSAGGAGVFPFLAVGAFVAALAVGEADDRRLRVARRAVASGVRETLGRLR